MSDLVRFQVPCKIEYTKLVEEITHQVSTYLQTDPKSDFSHRLRAVMNEVFINIVKHTETAAQDEMVRFQFELGLDLFTISIYDYGPGFPAKGHYPPYPSDLIGNKYKLRDVIDGTVYFTVVDPVEVSFSFVETQESDFNQLSGLDMLEDHGLGISIVTKLMDTVTYSYIGQGKFDWKLIKRLG